jgi:hypothetical protein
MEKKTKLSQAKHDELLKELKRKKVHYYGATQLTFMKSVDMDGAQIKKQNPRFRPSNEEKQENMLRVYEEKSLWDCMPCCKKSETLDIDIGEMDGADDTLNRSTLVAGNFGMLSTSQLEKKRNVRRRQQTNLQKNKKFAIVPNNN